MGKFLFQVFTGKNLVFQRTGKGAFPREGPQHEQYLGGRIHGRPSSQQFLDQAHVALLGGQVQSIESILKEKKQASEQGV